MLKLSRTQILLLSLEFNGFNMIQEYFSQSLEFLKIKMGRANFWGEPILQKVLIILSPLLYFNLETLKDPNSSSFIRFQCILYDSEEILWDFWNFFKFKSGDLISGRNQFCKKSGLFGPPILYFNFKIFKNPDSLSFIRFQCVLYDSRVLFSESWNFYKFKRGGLISGVTNFPEGLNYLVSLSVFQIENFEGPKLFVIY